MLENIKIISIGDEGRKNYSLIKEKLDNFNYEDILLNQDVDKDYVRNLLDGVDLLFLTYSSEDKRAREIVSAVSFMANERRILSIGLNSSNKEIKEDLGVNRQFIINENIDILTSIINMMVESISEDCMINIDLSDLKETLCTDKGIKFAYKKFNKNTDSKEMSEVLLNSIIEEGEELTNKKSILFIEVDDKETEILLKINEILLNIQESSKDNVDFIFSLNTKENLDENLNLGIIYN